MPSTERPTDLILHGGRIRTMSPDGALAQAVAIAGNRVTALGTDRDVLRLRGPHPRVVDLRGRTALPGFTDAHTHPISGGLRHVECDLDRFDTAEDHLAAIAAYAAANPDREWIGGPLPWPVPRPGPRIPRSAASSATRTARRWACSRRQPRSSLPGSSRLTTRRRSSGLSSTRRPSSTPPASPPGRTPTS